MKRWFESARSRSVQLLQGVAEVPAEFAFNALDPRLQRQVTTAEQAAAGGRPEFASDICRRILVANPGCLHVRRLLRQSREARNAGSPPAMMDSVLRTCRSVLALGFGRLLLSRDPSSATLVAERVIGDRANAASGHILLARAAEACGWRDTAVFAWECALACAPRDTRLRLALGKACCASGRSEQAIQAAEAVLRESPDHPGAESLLHRACVAKSLDSAWYAVDEERDDRPYNHPNRKPTV